MIASIYYYFYFFEIIFLISSVFIKNKAVNKLALTMCLILLGKWMINFNKCAFVYLECKARKIKAKDSFIHNLLHNVVELNKSRYKYFLYISVIMILLLNFDNLWYKKKVIKKIYLHCVNCLK